MRLDHQPVIHRCHDCHGTRGDEHRKRPAEASGRTPEGGRAFPPQGDFAPACGRYAREEMVSQAAATSARTPTHRELLIDVAIAAGVFAASVALLAAGGT